MKPVLDAFKVKDGFEEVNVVGDRVHDGDLERTVGELPSLGQVELIFFVPALDICSHS